MKRIVIIIMTLVGCLIHPNIVEAQKVKDAFILVDVSGSMKYTQINSEAKQIICSMLQGNLNLSNFSGWSQVKTKGLEGNCPLISEKNSSLISAGGKVCILPFGNMERVRDYKFVDMSNFETSFNSYFPNTFKDNWTYITLAKAYAVNLASKNGISGMVYMIIYSDGAEESMCGGVGYPAEFRSVVDYFGTCNDSFCQKKGIIRKSYNGKQFDIEIWTMGPILSSVCPKCQQNPCVCGTPPPPRKIAITNPIGGRSPQDQHEIKTKESISIKWKNATGNTNINVQVKKNNSYANINVNDRDNYFTLDKNANSATITFYEACNYRIIVGDNHSRDMRYIGVSAPPFIFPLLIIGLIIGGVCLFFSMKPRKDPGPTPSLNSQNTEDEW